MNALIVQGRSKRRSWTLGVALAALAIATPACNLYTSQPTRGQTLTLEVAGVVAAKHFGVEGSRSYTDYTFEDGGTYRLYDAAGPTPVVGDLLLSGSKPWLWVDRAGLEDPKSWPAGCYGYNENGYNRVSTIELDNGLTLQKTADFTWPAAAVHKDNRISGETLCLNKQGQVFTIVG